jgi:ankyrin repeat protein
MFYQNHALHSACEGGFVDIVDLLLRYNCNINQCQPLTNQSPLIVACDGNKEAVVKHVYMNFLTSNK